MGRCEPVAFLRFLVGRERCTFSSASVLSVILWCKRIAGGVEGIHAVILRPVAPRGELTSDFYQTRYENGFSTKLRPLAIL